VLLWLFHLYVAEKACSRWLGIDTRPASRGELVNTEGSQNTNQMGEGVEGRSWGTRGLIDVGDIWEVDTQG